jgi:hypothetical protein
MGFSLRTILTEIAVISLYCGDRGISREDAAAQRFIHMRAEVLKGSRERRTVESILDVGEDLIDGFRLNDSMTANAIEEMRRNPTYAQKMYNLYTGRILPMLADDFRN